MLSWLVRITWLLVAVVILATVGRSLLEKGAPSGKSVSGPPAESEVLEKRIPPPVDWSAVDRDVVRAMRQAREQAEAYADQQLQQWLDEMMQRVDENFLPWYFSYWTQQVIGLKGLWQYGRHALDQDVPTAEMAVQELVEREFAKRVLRPHLAELRLQRIVRETVWRYVDTLRQHLSLLPRRYHIPPRAWSEHLARLTLTVRDFDSGREVPLTLKALTVAGGGGAVLLAAKMKGVLSKALGKSMGKAVGKVGAKVAAKAGGEAAAKAGGKLLGLTLGIGILLWDVWDHQKTVEENRPLLRQAIAEHLQMMKDQLLHDPEAGLSSVFRQMEQQLVHQLASAPTEDTEKAPDAEGAAHVQDAERKASSP